MSEEVKIAANIFEAGVQRATTDFLADCANLGIDQSIAWAMAAALLKRRFDIAFGNFGDAVAERGPKG